MRVFISHVTREASLASVLKTWIESAFLGQVDVFVSSEGDDITAGDQWFRQIEDALAGAKMLLIICSPSSVYRPWINFEAGAGWIKEVPVIPVCHSGMTKSALPAPLSFFQGLDAEEADFANKLVTALTKNLGFPREPRIPYQEMTAEIRDALLKVADQSGQPAREEDMGIFDHLVAMQEGFDDLSKIILTYGDDAKSVVVEITKFVDQFNRSQANKSEGTNKHLQQMFRKFGEKMDAYAQKLGGLNQEYEKVLPDAEHSMLKVINLQTLETVEDQEAVETSLVALDYTETSIDYLKSSVLDTRQTLNKLPNYQRHMHRAIRNVVKQYDNLILALDKTLDMLQQARAVVKLLKSR